MRLRRGCSLTMKGIYAEMLVSLFNILSRPPYTTSCNGGGESMDSERLKCVALLNKSEDGETGNYYNGI